LKGKSDFLLLAWTLSVVPARSVIRYRSMSHWIDPRRHRGDCRFPRTPCSGGCFFRGVLVRKFKPQQKTAYRQGDYRAALGCGAQSQSARTHGREHGAGCRVWPARRTGGRRQRRTRIERQILNVMLTIQDRNRTLSILTVCKRRCLWCNVAPAGTHDGRSLEDCGRGREADVSCAGEHCKKARLPV